MFVPVIPAAAGVGREVDVPRLAKLVADGVIVERGPDPDAAMEVEKLLSTLSPADRFILLMLDGEGWSVAEIADKLGWSKVNVKVRAHRARKKLRRLLEEGL